MSSSPPEQEPSEGPEDPEQSASRALDEVAREEVEETLPGDQEAPEREAREPPEALARGSKIGRYTVLEKIGAGGMGVVYAAFDPVLDRKVALKVMHPGAQATSRGRRRLMQEAKAMARLSHPNVITVHDVDTHEGRVFVAMEFIEGLTLSDWLRKDDHDWPSVVDAFVRAGRGLAAAHASGLVHRDFKPENVLVGRDGRIIVMDFGLARQAPNVTSSSGDVERTLGRTGDQTADTDAEPVMLTRTGALLGTPAYMAPEQHRGEPVGPLADQFSFAIALYEGLYGERPFVGTTVASLAINVLDGRVKPPPRDTKVPTWLRAVVLRALSVDPTDRYPSMDALLAELQRDPPQPKRPWVVLAVAGSIAGAITLGYLAAQPKPDRACQDADGKLEALWNEERRQQLHERFAAVDRPYAEATWKSVERAIDGYVRRWTSTFEEACRTDLLRQRTAGRSSNAAAELECVQEHRTELEALLDGFEHMDPVALQHAVRAAQALPRIERCLQSSRPDLLPRDRDAADLEDELHRLARARTALEMGQTEQALQATVGLIAQLEDDQAPALRARALLLLGRSQHAADELGAAERSLRDALLAASAAGRSDIEADIWATMLALEERTERSVSEARRLALATEAALVRSGDDPIGRASLLVRLGSIEQSSGHYDAALDHYQQALALRTDFLPPDDLSIATAREGMGLALAGLGRFTEAATQHQDALSLREQVLGAQHPDVGLSLIYLGQANLGAARLRPAEASLVRARMLLDPRGEVGLEQMSEPDEGAPVEPEHEEPPTVDVHLGWALDGLGLLARAKEEFEEAARLHARSAALVEHFMGRSHPDLAYPLENLGVSLVDQDRPSEALPHLRRALELWTSSFEDEHPDLATAHLNLANALWATGSPAQAGEHYEKALEIWEATLPPEHPLIAYALTGLGRTHLASGASDPAIEVLERALAIRDHEDEDPLNRAETSLLLGRALWVTRRDPQRALELAMEARDATGSYEPADTAGLERLLDGQPVPRLTDQLVPAGLGVTNPRHAIPPG